MTRRELSTDLIRTLEVFQGWLLVVAVVYLLVGCGDDVAPQLDAGGDQVDAQLDARGGRPDGSGSVCPFVCEPPLTPACTVDPAGVCTCTCEGP